MANAAVRAVLFDFGGVITESPFAAFRAFERERGLPEGFIQSINRRDPDTNAWARFERSELSAEEFDLAFAAETRAAGFELRGLDVIALLYGPVRPQMTQAVARCKPRFLTACLTNNMRLADNRRPAHDSQWSAAMALFDVVIESSQVGARKPEPRFFTLACERIGIDPRTAVFLDDIGSNLKPARAMGMRTIKVSNPDEALRELEQVLGIALR